MNVFSDNAKVKLVYIRGTNTPRQEVIYEGSITGFRDNLNVEEFNGFDKRQLFTLVDEDVKILNKMEVINSDSIITDVVYYIGPE